MTIFLNSWIRRSTTDDLMLCIISSRHYTVIYTLQFSAIWFKFSFKLFWSINKSESFDCYFCLSWLWNQFWFDWQNKRIIESKCLSIVWIVFTVHWDFNRKNIRLRIVRHFAFNMCWIDVNRFDDEIVWTCAESTFNVMAVVVFFAMESCAVNVNVLIILMSYFSKSRLDSVNFRTDRVFKRVVLST